MKRSTFFLAPLVVVIVLAGIAQAKTNHTRFAVLSDPHLYDVKALGDGPGLDLYLAQDRKMLRESEAILSAAVEAIIDEDVDFVIVSGDLTKDGERANHKKFARYLSKLEKKGIEAYVVPGNHDINNPHAYAYNGDTATPVDYVTPAEFKKIFKKNGYSEALDQDHYSLSYVVEPSKGIWLFALDSCKYQDNIASGEPETGGGFSPETMEWIERMLGKAQHLGKTPIAFLHHGLTEHFAYQIAAGFGDYVIDDHQNVAQRLSEAGLNLAFTGHFHAQDITAIGSGDKALYDVETGSLVTYPCAFRVVTFDGRHAASISSRYIEWIDYPIAEPSFQEHAYQFLYEGLKAIAAYQLIYDYELDEGQAGIIAPYVADAFVAHYAGDEYITDEASAFIAYLKTTGGEIGAMLGLQLTSLWTDLPPSDSELLVPLSHRDHKKPMHWLKQKRFKFR